MKDWEKKKLGEVYDVRDGTHDSPKFVKEGYALITSKNLKDDKLNYDSVNYITEQDYININKRSKVGKGDILFAMIGTIGNPIVVKDEPDFAIKNVALFKVPTNQDSYFLKYYLDSSFAVEQMTKDAKGATQKFVGLGYLRNFEILLPSLNEQQRIVAILDEAFAIIEKAKANAEQNLKNAKELFESYLQAVFENKGENWEEKTLDQISKTFGRGKSKHRPRNWDGLYGGNYPFIQTGDIRNCDHYITKYTQTYNETGLAQSKLWKAGTICITIAANIAETGIITFDSCFPDSVIGIEVNENYADRDFVEYLLQSFKVRLQALGKGSAQANINMGTFENHLFPFPSVKEQKTIVQSLNALSNETKKLETIYRQKINDLEELKKSILQKAFTGALLNSELAEKKPKNPYYE